MRGENERTEAPAMCAVCEPCRKMLIESGYAVAAEGSVYMGICPLCRKRRPLKLTEYKKGRLKG